MRQRVDHVASIRRGAKSKTERLTVRAKDLCEDYEYHRSCEWMHGNRHAINTRLGQPSLFELFV